MKKRLFRERLKWRLLRLIGITPDCLSYSQAGEDRILYYLISVMRIYPVLYVDLGCNNPTSASNTYLFYCQGGYGIVVDPAREFQEQYRRLRPRDQFIHAAVCDTADATAQMTIFENSALNTLDGDVAETYVRLGHNIVRTEEVPSVSLTQLLEMAGRNVDLLSIDAEGFDLRILKSNDYARHSPTIICVETVSYKDNNSEIFDSETSRFLQNHGYVEYANSHINTIFVKRDRYDAVAKI